MTGSASHSRPIPHIGIIGAGVSGLRCASILLSQGFEVTILEARDRIGGRSEGLGYTVDIGPNWIHASNDPDNPNPIYDIAGQTNTPLHRWNNKQRIFDSLGEELAENVADKLSTVLWDTIEEAFQFSAKANEKGGTTIPSEDSLYDFIRRKADEKLSDENERSLLLKMSEMFGAYVGEPVWRQSLRFAWMEECCGGDEVFVTSTYSNILEEIARPAKGQARILLNTYIESISAPLDARSGSRGVTLTSREGKAMEFDEVVITTPLGWLKRNQDAFSPPLPLPITSAISSLSLSQLEKVFVTFPSAFWRSDPNIEPSEVPCYTNWLRPAYTPDTNPSEWPQEIWDLVAFDAPNQHPTILFYTYGDCSRHIVNTIHDMSPEEEFQFLNDFFRPFYSRLPGYAQDAERCKPKAILATKWLKDPLNGNASYCNFQVGVEKADENVLAFREGCPERRLWFCGEHAAPFEECGTVAGAYLSGEAAANKIAALYGRSGK